MSPRRCVSLNIFEPLSSTKALCPIAPQRRVVIWVFLFLSLVSPRIASSSQTIIVNVNVNTVARGEYFVILEESGNFLVRTTDLLAMDFRDPKGKTSVIDGEEYMSLVSMKGISFVFNEKRLALDIEAAPELLLKRTIDFMPQRGARVYYPRDSSAFLNYRLSYGAGSGLSYQSLGLTNQLGVRWRDLLLLGDTSYVRTERAGRFARLMTALTYDDRANLRRGVAGDFFASSGELGSNLNLGGLSFSKTYKLDPYLIKYPTFNLSGLTSMPSDVEVYVDGIRLATDKLAPGEFEIRNITNSGGAHSATILIRDPFGNVQRITRPFYQTEALLGRGLTEYSYNAGYMRQEFGVKSWRYTDPAFSFFHKYGYSDGLTLTLRGEGGNNVLAAGPEASALLGGAGVVTLTALADRERDGKSGAAASLSHAYYERGFSTRLFLRVFSREFRAVADRTGLIRTKAEAAAGVGFNVSDYGNVSLDYALVKRYGAIDTRSVTASLSRSLWHTATFVATLKRKVEAVPVYEAFMGVVYYFGTDSSLSAHYSRGKYTNTETIQLLSPAPSVGEGAGLRASLDRIAADGTNRAALILNPVADYNARHAVLRGEYRARQNADGTDEAYDLSMAGAIAYVDDTIALTRPIYDSFGMIKAGEIEGVRASVNGQEAGRTDKNGIVFIPSLGSFYDNRISINAKDVPMDYLLTDVQRTVSPPLRSGSCIVFDAKKIRAFTGNLRLGDGEAVGKPLEFYEVSISVGDKILRFPTGKDGEFYFENIDLAEKTRSGGESYKGCASIGVQETKSELLPGTYRASLNYNGNLCAFDITIPDTGEVFVDLAAQTCTLQEITVMNPPQPIAAGLLFKEETQAVGAEVLVPEQTPQVLPAESLDKLRTGPLPVEEALPETVGESAPVAAPLVAQAPALQAVGAGTVVAEQTPQAKVLPESEAALVVTPVAPLVLRPAPFTVHLPFNRDMPSTVEDVLTYYDASVAAKGAPGAVIEIEGHCDQIGSDAYNMRLGRLRAQTAEKALVGLGVPRERIVSVRSYGERRLACAKDLSPGCRAQNRRVVIRIKEAQKITAPARKGRHVKKRGGKARRSGHGKGE